MGVKTNHSSTRPVKNRPRVETGPAAGKRLDRRKVRETLREYYRDRGWDEETGIPTPEKLAELGL